jgi:hypothetical protein
MQLQPPKHEQQHRTNNNIRDSNWRVDDGIASNDHFHNEKKIHEDIARKTKIWPVAP